MSPSGSSTSNGTISNPISGIQNAINLAQNGDTIILMNGIYSSSSDYNLILAGKRLTIRSQFDNPTTVTVDCNGLPAFPFNSRIFPFETKTSVIVRVCTSIM